MTSCMYCKAPAKANHVCIECEEMSQRLEVALKKDRERNRKAKESK